MAPRTDLEKWNAVGPVRTLHRETATWDSAKENWGPPESPQEADFTTAGRLAELREYGGDGSVARTNWTYDGAGRVVEVTMSSTARSDKWRRFYDTKGKPLRTVEVASDGTERVVETWGVDEGGRPTRVQLTPLVMIEPRSDDDVEHAGFASSDNISQVTSTSIYDAENRIVEVRYHDASHTLLFTVMFTRDAHGRIVLEEDRFDGGFGFGKEFGDKLANASDEERQEVEKLMAAALDDGVFSSTAYDRDADGHILTSSRRMGTMDETRTTFTYDANWNEIERVELSQGAGLSLDDTGLIVRTEESETSRRTTSDYIYDDKRNWIERVSTVHDPTTEYRSIERRVFTYYPV
jgi:hypothetical protein